MFKPVDKFVLDIIFYRNNNSFLKNVRVTTKST